jgi:glycine cleavage system H protein
MATLYFSKTHEWISVDGTKGKIGLSDHAQKELGDLVFVELPSVGDRVEAGKAFLNVESVKAVSEAYAPATGIITAVNEELESAPEKINESAMDAWIVEIEVEKLADDLMSESEYNESL